MAHLKQNIFVSFLDLLKVKYTSKAANKLYEEHPHRYNLYGLSSMLSEYGIENAALRMNKEAAVLSEMEAPFLAFVGSDFALVHKITPDEVSYYWQEKNITISTEEFLKLWSGIVLIAEKSEESIEPNYVSNRYKELLHSGEKAALFLAIITGLTIIGIHTNVQLQVGRLFALLINAIGVYISYLLLLKQMHINSNSANKICSLFLKQGDCNNILDSKAAKFLGTFSWSEIGLGYFTANIIIILCYPGLFTYLAIINILALPYTIWSIWYQAKIAQQWCVLCVIVQALLWLLFTNNLIFGLIKMPDINIPDVLLTGCIYGIPILALNLIIPYFINSRKLPHIVQQLNSLKADDKIFTALLKQQSHYEIDKSLGLLWGDSKANHTITVITNPHCNPCAHMHDRLKKLLEDTQNGYCIQYILTSFNEELEQSSRLFIAMYQQKEKDDYLSFLDEWYAEGKNNHKEFYTKYPFDIQDEQIQKEHLLQKEWLEGTVIRATPTILFDGYELPNKYQIEDVAFFR